MVGSQYAQRLQDESKSVEVTGDKDRELGKDAVIDPHMIIVVNLLPDLDILVDLPGTHEPLLIIVQLAIGTDMPLEVSLLTTILMYLHTFLHLMLAENTTNQVQFIAVIDALKLRLLLVFELRLL